MTRTMWLMLLGLSVPAATASSWLILVPAEGPPTVQAVSPADVARLTGGEGSTSPTELGSGPVPAPGTSVTLTSSTQTTTTTTLTSTTPASGTGSTAPAKPTTAREAQLLGRLGYGHSFWNRNRLRELGLRAYVDEQLDPASVPDPAMRTALREEELDIWRMPHDTIRTTFGPRKERGNGQIIRQAKREFMLRAIVSRRQVEAVLTEFWANHFNVNLENEKRDAVQYVRDTIRPNVLGKFEDLCLAVAKSPAMLKYLDNDKNYKQGFQGKGINENFARELLELHTFGVDDQQGVYTQRDIEELARCLTGWTTAPSPDKDGYRFLANAHDTSRTTLFKTKDGKFRVDIAAGHGEEAGERVIRHLSRRRETGKNICHKLIRFFVGVGPFRVPELRQRMIDTWVQSQGNLKRVTRIVLMSPELREHLDKKVKRPTLLLASAVRTSRAQLGTGQARAKLVDQLVQYSAGFGLPIYGISPPTGWEDSNGTFVNEGTMIERFNTLNALFTRTTNPLQLGWDPASGGDAGKVARLERVLLGTGRLTDTTGAALTQLLADTAGVEASRRGRLALAAAVCSPEFARH